MDDVASTQGLGGAASDATLPYLAFFDERDGEADFDRHTLARREELFTALARDPVRSRVRLDRAVYLRNLARRRPERGLDPRMLWVLATAKANQAERFGVGLAELYGQTHAESDAASVHVTLQEFYHTRILADVVAVFGLPVRAQAPPLPARLVISAILGVPEAWRLPLAGSSEMVGCLLFRALRDRGLELFADEPAVTARIRLLYDQILADEISHVGLITARLGRTGRAAMRGLYRLMGHRLATAMPEMVRLFGRAELVRRFRAPFRLDELTAEYPQLAFATATP